MTSRGRGGSISDWDPMRDDFYDNAQNPDDTSDNQLDPTNLYVTRLPPALSQEGFVDLFSKYGTIVHSFFSRDVQKRFAFIRFETAGEARIAMMKLNRTEPFCMNIVFAHKKTASGPGRTSQPNIDRSSSNIDRQLIRHSTTDKQNQSMDKTEDCVSVSSVSRRKTRNVEHINGNDDEDETEESVMGHDPKLGYDLEKIKLKRLEIMDQQLEVQQRMLIHQQRMKLNATVATKRRLLPDGRSIQITRDNETSITAGGGDSRNIPGLQREASRRCVSCDAPAELFCAGCRLTPYCAERCQRRDWEARHRAVCHNLASSSAEVADSHVSPLSAPDIRAVAPLRKPHASPTKSPCVVPASDSGSEREGKKFIPPSEKHAALQVVQQRRGNPAANNNRSRQEGPRNRHEDSRNPVNQGNRLDKQDQYTPLRQPKLPTPEPTKPIRVEPTPPEPKPESEKPSVTAALLGSKRDVTPRKPLVPSSYVVEKLSVGASFLAEIVGVASECGSQQAGCVCLTLHEDYSERYDSLCDDFKEQCQKDDVVYTPRIGETFAYLCTDDGFWYRARCLARTRAALLDAGRVVSLSPSACRRLPPSFATIPEFMAVLKTKDLAIGSNLSCKVISLSSAGITVSVEDASGTSVQVKAARWSPDIEYADEAQNLPRQPNLKQSTPEPQTVKPAQDELPSRATQSRKPREVQVAESRPKSSVSSRLATETPRQPLVPANYVIEKLSVGASFLAETVGVASECGSQQAGCVCLTLHEDYSERYDSLCDDFKEQCQKDDVVYTPRIGETFAYLCAEDGFWYRARCLARTRAALLDSGRVVSLSPSACRRLPPSFATIPEFMAVLNTKDLEIGSNLSCKVISSSSAGITVSVEDASGTSVQVEAARWSPVIEYADEPQHPPLQQPNLKQPIPEPQAKKPAQVEPASRKQREPVASRPESVTRKPLIPANYVIENLSVGASFLAETVGVASECGSQQAGCVCLTLHEDYSERYDSLCDYFKEQCQKDDVVYTPRIGETFAYLCTDDGFWYRARCLAGTRAALLDAGRVVSLSPSACRRLPPSFATIPEFMAVLKTKDLEIGCHFSCKVVSSSSASITVSVEDQSGTTVQVEAARWSPDIEYADEPVATQKSTPVSVPTPVAASTPDVAKPTAVVPEVPRPRLENNTLYVLLDVTSLRRACVRPCDLRPAAAFDAVLQDTVLYGVNAIPLKEPPQKGQTVVAKFMEDGTHYRAFVKRVNVALNKYLIEYIEYGNEEIVPFERLFVCPPKLQLDVKPAQASLVKLSEREPVTLSPAAVKYIDTLKENAIELILTIPGGDKTTPSGSLVTLLKAKNCEPISKKIEDLCIPEWKKLAERGGDVLEMETRFFSQLKYSTIPTNRPFVLRVTYCDEKQLIRGIVCGYEKGNKAADLIYGELAKQIMEYCQSSLCKDSYLPKIEELCIAKNTKDSAWVRSVLIELPQGAGSRAGSMVHLDSGLIEDVPVCNLRRIPPELVDAYPALANHLEIKDFPQDQLSQQQIERAMRFMKMTPEGTGELRVSACRLIEDNFYEMVVPELIDILTQ